MFAPDVVTLVILPSPKFQISNVIGAYFEMLKDALNVTAFFAFELVNEGAGKLSAGTVTSDVRSAVLPAESVTVNLIGYVPAYS
jgi:hypothetical protein